MIRSKKFPQKRVRTTVAWTLILVLFAHATSLTAQDDCQVHDRYGLPRNCTWTEELAACNLDVFDSWEQCMEDADNWLERVACEATGVADTAACIASGAVDWLDDLFS